MKDRLCFIEDDPTIRELVGEKLVRAGFEISSFDNAEVILQAGPKGLVWDLYLVDIMLRGERDGLDLCRFIRRNDATVPILVLSALSEPGDRIEGLRDGADDYLTKPFEMEELLLRVRGMLKRRSWYRELPKDQDEFRWGQNRIHFVRMEGAAGAQAFDLTQKECMLMKLLIEREGDTVTRDEILDRVWGYDDFPSTRTVDNLILKLRKCFEPESSAPKHIHSVRGQGYRFTEKAT